jgi:hypothetical protein
MSPFHQYLSGDLMAHLSILGTGNVGQAIAAVAGKGGHTVHLNYAVLFFADQAGSTGFYLVKP